LNNRNHPALLSWYSADEPWPRITLPEKLEEYYRVLRRLDPFHPISAAFDSRYSVKRHSSGYDIAMPDIYPVPELVTETYSTVGQYFCDIDALVGSTKPVWAVLQAYNKTYYPHMLGGLKPELFERLYPTYQEIRNMTFQALVEKVRGITYYEFPRLFEETNREMWDGLSKTTRELRALSPVLLSDNRIRAKISPTDNDVRGLWLKHDQDWVLLIVNPSKVRQIVWVDVPENTYKTGNCIELLPPDEKDEMHKVLLDKKVVNQRIEIELDPVGVRVFSLSKNQNEQKTN